MRLEDLYPSADFKSKVEGCAVKHRYIARRDCEATKSRHKWLEALVWKHPDLITQWADAGDVGRSRSGNVGCGPDINLILGHQNNV